MYYLNNSLDFFMARILFLLCVFLSIVFPAKLQAIKLPIFFMVFFFTFLWISRTGFNQKISRFLVFLALLFSFSGCVWSFYGVIAGNPGAFNVVNVMAIYPLVFVFLSFLLFPGDLASLERFFLITCIAVISYQAMYLASASGVDGGRFFAFNQKFFGDVANGFQAETLLSFSLPNVAALLFFMPFFALNAFCSKKIDVVSLFLVCFMIFLAFAAGRRGLYVSFAISFLFCTFLVVVSGIRSLKVILARFFVFLLIFSGFMLFIFSNKFLDLENMTYELLSIVDFSDNQSNLERKYQFESLYSSFENSPFVGNGAGAAGEYVRSIKQPWAYELFYVAFLFQYGVFGFSLYFIGVLYISLLMLYICMDKSLDENRRFFFIKFLSGFISFCIASATNPYLAKFDYMWVIFIPVAMVNCYLVHRKI